jgi:hypothetical protein
VIEVKEPVAYILPECFEPTGRDAANVDIGVSHLVPAGKKGLLPMTYRVSAKRSDLAATFGQELAGRILASPLDHLDEIFSKLVLQKEIREGERAGWYTRLINGVMKPRDAVDKGILEISGGDSLTMTLSLYVLDDSTLEAFESYGYLIVPDGSHNGTIVDPIWLNMWRPGYAASDNTQQGQNRDGGSGGCTSGSGAAILAAIIIAGFTAARRKKFSRG